MINVDNYKGLIRSMDRIFDVQKLSYEHLTYFELFERHLQRFSPTVRDYE